MQTNIGSSIQDYCKKINSWLTFIDILSLFVILLVISIFAVYIGQKGASTIHPVIYTEGNYSASSNVATEIAKNNDTRPFGSSKGKTYTFSWCSGSKNISAKNKVYYASELAAQKAGKTLSKLCRK